VLFLLTSISLVRDFFKADVVAEDELCETLITMSFITSTAMQLIRFLIEEDYTTNSNEEASLFKDNATVTKIIKTYLMRTGVNYLQDRLGDILNQIVVNERKVSLELNPR
jgi:hypothetical protein